MEHIITFKHFIVNTRKCINWYRLGRQDFTVLKARLGAGLGLFFVITNVFYIIYHTVASIDSINLLIPTGQPADITVKL